MIRLETARKQRDVEEAIRNPSATYRPGVLLNIGGKPYGPRFREATVKQEAGTAIQMDGRIIGNLPKKLTRAPVEMDLDLCGTPSPLIRGHLDRPTKAEDGPYTVVGADTAGAFLEGIKLRERNAFVGWRPDAVIRYVLRNARAHDQRRILIEPYSGPVIGPDAAPFETTSKISDVLQEMKEPGGYSYRDTVWNGFAAERISTRLFGVTGTPDWEFDAGKSFEFDYDLEDEQYSAIRVIRTAGNGEVKVLAEVALNYFDLDYPPLAGTTYDIEVTDASPGAEARALRLAQEAAERARKGVWSFTMTVPIMPLVELNDRWIIREAEDAEEGTYLRDWSARIETSYEHTISDVLRTKLVGRMVKAREILVPHPVPHLREASPQILLERYGVRVNGAAFVDDDLGWFTVNERGIATLTPSAAPYMTASPDGERVTLID